MTAPLNAILDHLQPIIEIDTCNPPRKIEAEGPLLHAVTKSLPGFDISVRDLGDGCIIIDAVRGTPRVMFNVHLDTVPAAPSWTYDPFKLTRLDDRAIGLGTCDTSGAAAILMALAAETDAPMRLVLSTDEEAGQSRCIRTFVEEEHDVDLVVVAEPTDALVRLQHRGLCSVRTTFEGESAHASEATRPSAIHQAARFIASALDLPIAPDNRLNFGRIEGGMKPNMVAAHAELLFGFRSLPGVSHQEILDQLQVFAPEIDLTPRFVGPSFPSDRDGPSAAAVAAARAAAETIGLPIGDPVDFWTEASLFAAAGLPTMVLGAGSIQQAHNADEFVTYEQLTSVYDHYARVVAHYAG
ncbi:MAG: acetylornithine deacetylase [Parvularculaceae bacterium]|nr:acetylornithine deacetylase [Parvularculaceae bacterium]